MIRVAGLSLHRGLSVCFVIAIVAVTPLIGRDAIIQDTVGQDSVAQDAEDEFAIEEAEITSSDRDHWSYRPIVRPSIPHVKDSQWPSTPIDRFILARLENQSLRPAPAANATTLVRRLYWDLTGLPPTIDQIQSFVDDSSDDAYQRLVDELLASPEFGKRWGQVWLDLARYADTDGYEHDKVRDQAWKYRDWVIEAINDDLPYSDFVGWQIAGDELAGAGNSSDHSPQSLATAFCVSGPDMPDINSMDERRHVLLNEITSTVGSVMLGLQFGCAQCHDHKYDAISQADFYRLRAFFDSSIELKKNQSVSVLASHKDYPQTHLMIRGDWRRTGPPVEPAFPRVANLSGDQVGEDESPRVALVKWLTDPANPLTARVEVNRIWQHHFGTGLSSTPNDFGVMSDDPTHPELLDYLADELMQGGWSTKRLHRMIVMSNVYRTAGTRPTDEQRRSEWDQAVSIDPDNRLLSHFPRRRLSAEAIRDGLLAVSDSLNYKTGGPGVMPPLPAEMVKTLLSGQWKVTPSQTEHDRRSVYLFARRNLRFPFFATFDRPSADQPCARRDQSTTAIQSLMLLNSELMMQASERLARAVSRDNADVETQIRSLYQRLYSRFPNPNELASAKGFLATDASLKDLCRAMLNSNEFLYVD